VPRSKETALQGYLAHKKQHYRGTSLIRNSITGARKDLVAEEVLLLLVGLEDRLDQPHEPLLLLANT